MSNSIKLDKIDRHILTLLQKNGRITNAQLSAEAGISPPAMLDRVRRLEKNGIIRQYVALLDAEKLGKGTAALVSVSLSMHSYSSIDDFVEKINSLEEIQECYHVSGDEDFLLKVVVNNIKEYEDFVLQKLTKINGVRTIKTSFILSSFKHTTAIPIPADENEE